MPRDPPAGIARAAAGVLIAAFVTAAGAAVLVRFPETIRCPIVLVPDTAADPIQSPLRAVVHAVRVAEGQEVPAGTELFRIRSEEILSWRTELRTLAEDLRVRREIASKLEASHRAEVEIKRSEVAQAEHEVAFREKHLETISRLLERMERLAQEGNLSEVELLHRRLDLAESEKDLNAAQRSLQREVAALGRMATERSRRRAEDLAEIEKLTWRVAALRHQLNGSEGDLLAIRAPYAAVVISLAQRSSGAVVERGAELCQLARVDSGLTARLLLHEDGLPRLAPGQRLRLFFDAFPYQRYGSVEGTLEWISPAVVSAGERASFVGRASLDRREIVVQGQPRPLRAGMKGEARIAVGSRTLIEYVFEPIRQLRENLRRPATRGK
jgi:multidrug efflux pump subunit AcrA (membrane-fusion protein)